MFIGERGNELTHLWKSSGSKRTIWWYHDPSPVVLQYLNDMRDAIRYGVMKSYLHWKSDGDIPSCKRRLKFISSAGAVTLEAVKRYIEEQKHV